MDLDLRRFQYGLLHFGHLSGGSSVRGTQACPQRVHAREVGGVLHLGHSGRTADAGARYHSEHDLHSQTRRSRLESCWDSSSMGDGMHRRYIGMLDRTAGGRYIGTGATGCPERDRRVGEEGI